MTQCLVTGGAGFIGSHLVDALLAEGHEVRVLDNLSAGSLANLTAVRGRVEIIQGDITNPDVVRRAVDNVELVFHHAGLPSVARSIQDPASTHEACVRGTLNVLMAAHESLVRRVIFGASATAYGPGSSQPRRETEPVHPSSPYAVASLASEHYCAAFSQVHGLETVRLRYFNVFGPRQPGGSPYAAVIPVLVESMLGGRRPVLYGDGLQCRDFTYVDDVVQANLLAAEAPRVSSRVYNVGTGRATTILEIVERLNTILGIELRPIHTQPLAGDVRHSQADLTRSQAELGYCPCTDLEQTLRRCVDYYAARRKGPKRVGKQVCSLN
jgi:UDP-glucose 4-epimerase